MQESRRAKRSIAAREQMECVSSVGSKDSPGCCSTTRACGQGLDQGIREMGTEDSGLFKRRNERVIASRPDARCRTISSSTGQTKLFVIPASARSRGCSEDGIELGLLRLDDHIQPEPSKGSVGGKSPLRWSKQRLLDEHDSRFL